MPEHLLKLRRSIGKAVHAKIDRDAIRSVACPPAFRKYKATVECTSFAARFALRIGLHEREPSLVIDLGCGFGYLLLVAQHLGHTAVGIDVNPLYMRKVQAILGVDCLTHNLAKTPTLPPLLGRVDVILGTGLGWNWDYPRYSEWMAALVCGVADGGMIALDLNYGGADVLLGRHAEIASGIKRITGIRRQGQVIVVEVGHYLVETPWH